MVKSTIPVNVPGRSSFDKSFKNILTSKVGTLTPIVNKLVIPGSKGRMKISLSASLPPLASDTFMRADLKVEAFLTPLRLLYGGFESFLTSKPMYKSDGTAVVAALPRINIPANNTHGLGVFGPGTLADYLGIRQNTNETLSSDSYYNIFPFLCYHRIYDDWYRNARVQKPVFTPPINTDLANNAHLISELPFVANDAIVSFGYYNQFNDGVSLFSLRQRNYGDDYFTIAMPSAQQGSSQSVLVGGSFTISSLRAANSLQLFAERSGYGSPRLQDYVKAHYGADLNSGVAQRSILLGSASYPVYSKGVEANSANSATNNPFATVGARYGNAFASGTDFVCEFEANEPSILMVIASLVPEANYASGCSQWMQKFTLPGSQVDIPDPLLENVGNEPISCGELSSQWNAQGLSLGVFGYVPRNTAHKTSLNEVHGLLRDGQSLESFVSQRSFTGLPQISSSFLEIPTTALDGVTAVSGDLSQYGVWIDSFIDLKVSEPLSECAIPSLQDPAYEHGHTVYLNQKGGSL